MKKLCILVSLFLLLLSSVASAANWQWITSTDEHGYFFDTQTVRYTTYNNNGWTYPETALYWMKTVYTPSSAAAIAEDFGDDSLYATSWKVEKQRLNFSDRTLTFFGDTTYDNEAGIVIKTIYTEPYTMNIIPDTIGEEIMEHIQDFLKSKRLRK
jgi:hypothetical protein